jgi:uncharacterized protein YvpB/LysM repeat protein
MNMMKRLFRIVALVTVLILVDVSAAQGNSLPDAAYVPGVSGHAQSYNLSCEARSAVDLAAFWGISIGETEFLKALPYSDNPEKGYVGNPNEAWGRIPPHSYGVHATPVAETLQSYGLEAIGLSNLSWDDLRGEINAGHPVIVWIVGSMWDGTPVEYEAQDGSTVIVATFEHTMILTGYNHDTVQVVDAYSGQYQTYPLSMFIRSWAVLGNMAVFASRDVGNQDNPSAQVTEESYTVQPGDYLIALAKQLGLSWMELAQRNSISYPYVIHPGQVLSVPGVAEPVATEPVVEPEPVATEPVVEPEPAVTGSVVEPNPVPTNKVENFKVCLPMVQRNHVAQIAPPKINSIASLEPTQPVITLSSSILADFGEITGVDWQLLFRLKNLILPYLSHPGELLKLK